MSFLLFKTDRANAGDVDFQGFCTSAIFNYQVIGTGTVQFSGSNMPEPDVNNDDHWVEIVTVTGGTPDTEPFRQHCWDKIRYKVMTGSDIGIYVSSGVSG